MWYYRLIACLTALDLIGKSAIEGLPDRSFPREMPDGKPVLLLKKFRNRGLPLGFLEKRREVVKYGPLLVESLVLLRFSRLLPKRGRKIEKTALALVLAGGGSNLFDRFFRGYVVDYFSFTP
ncbi:signal peptidase II, partial [Stomatobaculum longum]